MTGVEVEVRPEQKPRRASKKKPLPPEPPSTPPFRTIRRKSATLGSYSESPIKRSSKVTPSVKSGEQHPVQAGPWETSLDGNFAFASMNPSQDFDLTQELTRRASSLPELREKLGLAELKASFGGSALELGGSKRGGRAAGTLASKFRAAFNSKETSGGLKLPDINAKKQHDVAKKIEVGNLGGQWKKLMNAQKAASQAKKSIQTNNVQRSSESSTDRQKSYSTAMGQKGINKSKHIYLEKGKLVPIAEVMALRSYFDDIDLDGNGTVTMEEICLHRRNKFVIKEDKIEGILLTLQDDFTFPEMLEKVYPHFSKVDIKLCAEAVEKRLRERQLSMSHAVVRKVSVRSELQEIETYWPSFATPEGVMSLQAFRDFLKVLNDHRDRDEVDVMYKTVANPSTQSIHKREFTMFWINMFRSPPVKWHEVEEEVLAFWESLK